MSKGSFVVMVAGVVADDMQAYVHQYLLRLMKLSRQHEGCLIYNVHQSLDNPSEFMMYSEWADQASFERHNVMPEIQEFTNELAKAMFNIRSPKTYWQPLVESDQ